MKGVSEIKWRKKGVKNNLYKLGYIHHNSGEQSEIYPKLISLIGFRRGEAVFDAGCSDGMLGKYIENITLIGGDLNVRNKKIRGYSKVIKCDIERKIPLKDKSINSTIAISVFQYLDKVDTAFKELMRITKDRIIVNIPNDRNNKLKHLFTPALAKTLGYVDTKFLKDLARKHNLEVKIIYLSHRFNWIRKVCGNYLAGGIIGIYTFPVRRRKRW